MENIWRLEKQQKAIINASMVLACTEKEVGYYQQPVGEDKSHQYLN